jgi:hypothetical protein
MSNSTTFMLSRTASEAQFKRNQNIVKHTLDGKHFGPVAHTVIIVLLLSVMGLMYLAQINKTNAYTYPINELETRKEALLDEKSQLEVEAARLGSLDTVKKSAVARGLTQPVNVESVR